MVRKLIAKEEWKVVKSDSLIGFPDFISVQELTNYDIFDTSKPNSKKLKKPAEKHDKLKVKCEEKVGASEKAKKKKNKKKKKKTPQQIEGVDVAENLSEISLATESPDATEDHDSTADLETTGKRKLASVSPVEPLTKKQKLEVNETEEKPDIAVATKTKKKRNKKKTKKNANRVAPNLKQTEEKPVSMVQPVKDMSKWNGLFVPEPVLKNLAALGFSTPTVIQERCLPAAISGKMDIIAAAETGSGKTLAFGIPVIDLILRSRENATAEQSQEESVMSDGEDEQEEDGRRNEEDMETSNDVDDEKEDDSEEQEDDGADEEDCENEADKEHHEDLESEGDNEDTADDGHPLYALVLTPTRELAYQIQDHLRSISQNTGIKCHVVVGGMSIQKQSRLLDECPEIVVATPGRLWDIYKRGNRHLSKLNFIRCLVIDEADRMVEKFHFEHLTYILEQINQKQSSKDYRRTFILSATLTYVPPKPQRLMHKKKKKNFHDMTTKEKLESLSNQIGIRGKPKVVDLTPKQRTAAKLTETRVNFNTVEEKDLHLYCFLKEYSARTIVFANSVDCVSRLTRLFSLLGMSPLRLFAEMQQKQRLKSLEKFKENSGSLLLATDLAARGLDIAGIEHVIHYEVPKTTESYIHRSGRTARANSEGFSVLFVGPKEVTSYRKIMKALERDDLPVFPVNDELIRAAKERVTLARKIELEEYNVKKKQRNTIEQLAREAELDGTESKLDSLTKKQRNRLVQLAKEAGIEDLDDFENKPLEKWQRKKLEEIARHAGIGLKGTPCYDEDEEFEAASARRGLEWSKKELKLILSQPLLLRSSQTSYPTKSGQMIWPYLAGSSNQGAIEASKKKSTVSSKGNTRWKAKRK